LCSRQKMVSSFVVAPIGELHTLAGSAELRRGEASKNTGVLKNAGLAVVDGIVVEYGHAESIIQNFDLPTMPAGLVTPGLVDAHTHIVWGGNRSEDFLRRSRGISYEQIAAEGGGIISTSDATRTASLDSLAEAVKRRADLMLHKGTTTIEVKASYGMSLEGCAKELDAIDIARKETRATLVATFMGAHALPPGSERDEFVSLTCNQLIPMAAQHPSKPAFCDVFCEVGAFSRDESERILRAGIEHGLSPKIHADEFTDLDGVQMAVALGATSCDHLLVTGETGKRALADSPTAAVLMPGTAMYLGKSFADARGMADAGCAVALGTDFNPGSSMVPSMAFSIGLAVSKMGLTCEEALTAATVNAAAAIGADAGRISPGKPADFCLWPCDSLAELAWQYVYIEPELVVVGGHALK
jgi:imidazolonepropionase